MLDCASVARCSTSAVQYSAEVQQYCGEATAVQDSSAPAVAQQYMQ